MHCCSLAGAPTRYRCPAGKRAAFACHQAWTRATSGQTAFSQESLHVALDGIFYFIQFDKNLCFYAQEVASSFDIAPHTGSELFLQAKLVSMILPVAARFAWFVRR